jgi:hypothetical protein
MQQEKWRTSVVNWDCKMVSVGSLGFVSAVEAGGTEFKEE